MTELNFIIKGLTLGTHKTPWDLKVLLFKGATSARRNVVMQAINNGEFGELVKDRLSFVGKLYNVLNTYLNIGKSRKTVISYLEQVWSFYNWINDNDMSPTEETIINVFKKWTEYLLSRVNFTKDLAKMTAYKRASTIARLITKALDLPDCKDGYRLMLTTRLKRPNHVQNALTTKADKQNLADTYEFGHTLTTICNFLDINIVRGKLPIRIIINEQKILTVAGNLIDTDLDLKNIKHSISNRAVVIARQPIADGVSLLDTHKRSAILNLRIESELLLFIGQTGMNLSQAAALERNNYRWQSDGEDYEVFRVYKGRREGEAIFRCYTAYRYHLQKYMNWLDETELTGNDGRLFPLISRGMIKAKTSRLYFSTTKNLFKKYDIIFINPSRLRNTRINWLLRHTNNLELTAEQMGNTADVLIKNYLRPHHQRASVEILEFHNLTDSGYDSPGPGICIDSHQPKVIAKFPESAPEPDCISPDGCLFCEKHRDIMSSEYCWKLVSHLKIKNMETGLYKPSEEQFVHPSNIVIDRILLKLKAISEGSEIRKIWVEDAQDSVRSGKYHPLWDGYIKLLEEVV